MEYTNVVDSAGAPTMGKGSPTPASALRDPSAPTVNPFTVTNPNPTPDLQGSMKLISEASDPMDKLKIFTELQNSVASHQAMVIENLRKDTELKIGIPSLEADLKINEQEDRKHPAWAKQQSDSRQTNDARANLANARIAAERESQNVINSNVKLKMMDQQMKGLATLLQFDIQRSERAADKKGLLDQKVEDQLSAISPEAKEAVWTVRPDLKGNDVGMVQFLKQELKTNEKEWQPILTGTAKPEDMMIYGVGGNKVAMAIAVKQQALKTGMPEELVVKHARLLNEFVNNPAAADRLIEEYGLLQSETEKKAYRNLGIKGNALGANEQSKARLGLVEKLASNMMVGTISNNLDKWPVAPGTSGLMNLPETKTIFEDTQKLMGRAPTIQEFFDAYTGTVGLTSEDRIKRSELVRSAYKGVLEKASSGVYGKNIDVVALTNRLMIRGALKTMPNIRSWR